MIPIVGVADAVGNKKNFHKKVETNEMKGIRAVRELYYLLKFTVNNMHVGLNWY